MPLLRGIDQGAMVQNTYSIVSFCLFADRKLATGLRGARSIHNECTINTALKFLFMP